MSIIKQTVLLALICLLIIQLSFFKIKFYIKFTTALLKCKVYLKLKLQKIDGDKQPNILNKLCVAYLILGVHDCFNS